MMKMGASLLAATALTMTTTVLLVPVASESSRGGGGGDLNYADALTKSIMFLECQRSGKLPANQRVTWRGDSGLDDGKLQNVDLVGGYYDAGDNVKFGFPMAFTITLLSWNALQYKSQLSAKGELGNTLDAIKWGTDYLLKASATPNTLWVQVGDPDKDHQCWERPEDMDTPRTLYKIDSANPGTEIAAETAAALSSASMAFSSNDTAYSSKLLERAKQLFRFADSHRGTYKGECPFYCSFSGFQDELLWAAAWLYRASEDDQYLQYLQKNGDSAKGAKVVAEFSWEMKYGGLNVLLLSMGWDKFSDYKPGADFYVCSILPDSPTKIANTTPGGLLYVRDGANTQYVTNTVMLMSIYSDLLGANGSNEVQCGTKTFSADDLQNFAKKQVEYLLGKNPAGMSYMVGFGAKYPEQAHHRGASIPSVTVQPEKTACGLGFSQWFHKDAANPNLLVGAIVGGPDANDKFIDYRNMSAMEEPCTYVNTAIVGPLAKLAGATKA